MYAYAYGSGMYGDGLVMLLMCLILMLLIIALIEFMTKRPGFGTNKNTYLYILKAGNSRGDIGKNGYKPSLTRSLLARGK